MNEDTLFGWGSETRRPLTEPPSSAWNLKKVLAAFAVMMIAIIGVNAWLIVKNDSNISPIDEWSYIDYIFQAEDGGIVRPGEPLEDASLEYLACQEILGAGTLGSGCGEPQDRADFPLGATSPAEIHPPPYFIVTAQLARVVDAVSGFDLINSARMVGTVWLGAGLLMWLLTFRAVGARSDVSLAILAVIAFTPIALSVSLYITPDAGVFLTSGVVFLTTVLWLQRRAPTWLLVIAGAFPVLIKVTHLLSAFAAAFVIILVALRSPHIAGLRRGAIGAVAVVGGTVLGLVGWQVGRAVLRVSESPVHPGDGVDRGVPEFIALIGYHVTNMLVYPASFLPVGGMPGTIVGLTTVVLAAAAVGGVIFAHRDSEFWTLALAATLVTTFGAAFLTTITLVLDGGFLIPTARYGLPFLVLWVLPLVLALRTRAQSIALWALAVGAVVAVVSGY